MRRPRDSRREAVGEESGRQPPHESDRRGDEKGIVGALLMRGVMIAIGAALITKLSWIIYVFGGFLVLTGVKMLLVTSTPGDFDRNIVVRLVRRLFPVTERYHGEMFTPMK